MKVGGERLVVGLSGVDQLVVDAGVAEPFAIELARLADLVEVRADRVVLTRRGRLLANEVSLRLE